MRVFVASASDELAAYREAACEVVRELGFQPLSRDPAAGRDLNPVEACARQAARADAVLAVVGWRRGGIPRPEEGGDGLRPWTFWEVRGALRQGKRVVAFVAAESWRPDLREDDLHAGAVLRDFRGELTPVAAVFDEEDDPTLPVFRGLVRRKLLSGGEARSCPPDDVELRRWPPPRLPERPYPVLLPYSHPDLLAGRERELAELRRLLEQPVPIVGLYAASGAGKSSLLAGGLVPSLRREGRAVAFDRHPAEPGLARRLAGDLVEGEGIGEDPQAFVELLLAVREKAGPPVLVLDQFEDLLRPEAERVAPGARAAVGRLLAVSAQRWPGLREPPCRWILAYRHEFHGRLFQWLGDVHAGGALPEESRSLPHDLSGPERFRPWPLAPLGGGRSGSPGPSEEAVRVFQSAVEKPLCLVEEGRPRYPWRFAPGHAERLARVFAEARRKRPGAPLVPELQVILAHLLEEAGEPPSWRARPELRLVEVPEDVGGLVDRALEDHLRRALDHAFPGTRGQEARWRRTRAVLALRELAGGHTRPWRGESGLLGKLATPRTRLVVVEERAGGWHYVLAHDRLAEVLIHAVDGGTWTGLGVDAELLALRRFVVLRSELFEAGEVDQATRVSPRRFRQIEAHADVLVREGGAGEDGGGRHSRERWWSACLDRRRTDRRRAGIRWSAALAVALVALVAWAWADRFFRRRALLEQVTTGDPESAFAALARLAAANAGAQDLLARLRARDKPFDVLESGVGGVGEAERPEAVLRAAELVLPLVAEAPEDPVRIASVVWALDFFAGPPEPARALRDRILAPLRRARPPPSRTDWVDVPAGTFLMGSETRQDHGVLLPAGPRHQVTLSAFRIAAHEVTFAEYRLLFPDYDPWPDGPPGRMDSAENPVLAISWYEAYTYAAWLGGRLPTEAEWEYAARAGCAFHYCDPEGNEAELSEVAWWLGNSTYAEDGKLSPGRIGQLKPNPWGLFDVLGNGLEWTANWAGDYSEMPQVDPTGPTRNETAYRVLRGGAFGLVAEAATVTARWVVGAEGRFPLTGLRVMLPAR